MAGPGGRDRVRVSADLRLQPAHGDCHGASPFAQLVERLHLGRLDEIRDALVDPLGESAGSSAAAGLYWDRGWEWIAAERRVRVRP
jgi:hypothetical protein